MNNASTRSKRCWSASPTTSWTHRARPGSHRTPASHRVGRVSARQLRIPLVETLVVTALGATSINPQPAAPRCRQPLPDIRLRAGGFGRTGHGPTFLKHPSPTSRPSPARRRWVRLAKSRRCSTGYASERSREYRNSAASGPYPPNGTSSRIRGGTVFAGAGFV